jgi:hypothetical protein
MAERQLQFVQWFILRFHMTTALLMAQMQLDSLLPSKSVSKAVHLSLI